MDPWLGESGSGSGMLRILFLYLCRLSVADILEVDVLMINWHLYEDTFSMSALMKRPI